MAFDANQFLDNNSGPQGDVDKSLAQYANLQSQYGTLPQEALTTAEGLGQGFLGPGATAIEKGLTSIGVPGLSPEEQELRAQANPDLSLTSKTAGLGVGFLTGTGEAALINRIGQGAEALSGLGKTASVISKIAATGVRSGAELAALQSGDELSKVINNDPDQSVGSAILNVGLSGGLGLLGGSAIGAVSPAWKTAANKLGVEHLANDFLGETKFLNENPELPKAAAQEVSGRIAEADQILYGGLKGQAISEALPEATPENLSKIDSHLQEISDLGEKRIKEAQSNAYLKGSAPRLAQDLSDFQSVISDPAASIEDKWDALDQYKRASQAHADYNVLSGGAEEKALSKWIKPFNEDLKLAAEDTSVWGDAGKIQKTVNKASSNLFDAQKDFLPKVTSKELGDRVADPDKLQSLINQSEKGKGALKQNAVRNYLDATQKAADAINEAHLNVGLEAPLASKLNPTPALDHTLNTPLSPGRSLAQWLHRKGAQTLANSTGETVAGIGGGLLGAVIGHPLVGAFAAEKVLGPLLSSLAKPFAENAINSEAMKASVDYVAKVAKGEDLLKGAAGSFFKAGAEIIPRQYLPNQESRSKLDKMVSAVNQNPNLLTNAGGNIGHYLPSHGTAIASMAARATQYLNSLKPDPKPATPFDEKPPVNKNQESRYERALDIAEQPLLVMKFAKEGTLLPQDIQTIQTIYPGLHSAIVKNLTDEMINKKQNIMSLPYQSRISLSQLMGSAPIDGTMIPQNMQAILSSAGPALMPQTGGPQKRGHPTGATLNQLNKVSSLYQTNEQARETNKRS